MKRVNWRALAAVLAFAALWWLFTLASRCDGRRPRPTELAPAGQPAGQESPLLLLAPGRGGREAAERRRRLAAAQA